MSRLTDRQRTADIIVGVLTGQVSVRNALLQFPSTTDKSIKCAWHALVHFEADEDIRARDEEFRQEQDEFLIFISDLLRKGQSIPTNILNEYENHHGNAALPVDDKSLWAKILAFFRFIHLN